MRISMIGRSLSVALGAATLLVAGGARATTVMEFPDNGSEQGARGGAWVARASDPLAAFYNPAGLAGQDTRVLLNVNVNVQSTCFTRLKDPNDKSLDSLAGPDGKFPQVCNDTKPFPNPQIAFAYKVNPRLALGIALLGPAAAGNASWPEQVNGKAAPQRYLLTNANVLYFTPTIGAGWEVVDNLRVGASLMWGIANLDFSNYSMGLNAPNNTPVENDVKAQLTAKQMFIPGFTLGALYSATPWLDIAGWYKWSAPINATGDVKTTYANGGAGNTGDTSLGDCGLGGNHQGTCGSGGNATIKVPVPMEAKLGFRYHKPREGVEQAHHRDPLAQDVFDAEVDLTWANNSAFDFVQIRFPSDATGAGTIPTPLAGAAFPPNADVRHHYKDVLGVRAGGDVNVIPDKLAVRAGAYFETNGQDSTYQNIDFAGGSKFGFAGGATYRIHFGSAETSTKALELSLGVGHTFVSSSTNNGPNGVLGTAGSACYPTESPTPAGANCGTGAQKYRAAWNVNLGTITNAFTMINVGVAYRF